MRDKATDRLIVFKKEIPIHERTFSNGIAATSAPFEGSPIVTNNADKPRSAGMVEGGFIELECLLKVGEYELCYCRGYPSSLTVETSAAINVTP